MALRSTQRSCPSAGRRQGRRQEGRHCRRHVGSGGGSLRRSRLNLKSGNRFGGSPGLLPSRSTLCLPQGQLAVSCNVHQSAAVCRGPCRGPAVPGIFSRQPAGTRTLQSRFRRCERVPGLFPGSASHRTCHLVTLQDAQQVGRDLARHTEVGIWVSRPAGRRGRPAGRPALRASTPACCDGLGLSESA